MMITPTDDQREAPRRRPESERPAMLQTWAELLFLHWRVDPEGLQKTLPKGLHLDTWDGTAWLGIVPFHMRKIRPTGLPIVPWISNFLELNVRTYVHDESGRPGVWFHSLDTNRLIASQIGRSVFKLPYFPASMQSRTDESGWSNYRCRRLGRRETASYRFRPEASQAAVTSIPGTLEFFLLERYLLFSHDPRSGRIFSGQVHHTPYHYRNVEVSDASPLPLVWGGLPAVEGPPVHACFAEPVDVEVFALKAVPPVGAHSA